ncbi:uncharacterized protein LOC142353034 [Convolutriloba macropyga]|uniref:uncharacterized protein LOC142353034 n=1 Tax=Convolutriloba macropyga TaxID=536237 RepID=UPI003F522ED2
MDVLLRSFVKDKMRELSKVEDAVPQRTPEPVVITDSGDSSDNEASKKSKKSKKRKKKERKKGRSRSSSSDSEDNKDRRSSKQSRKRKSSSHRTESSSKAKSKSKSGFYEDYEQVKDILENGNNGFIKDELPVRTDAYISRRNLEDNYRRSGTTSSRNRSRSRSHDRSRRYDKSKKSRRTDSSDSDFEKPRKQKKDDRSEVKTYILPQFNTNAFSAKFNSAPAPSVTHGSKAVHSIVNGNTTTKKVEYNSKPAEKAEQSIESYVKMCRQIAKDETVPEGVESKEEPVNVPWVSDDEAGPDAATGEWRKQDFTVKPANRIIQMNIPNATQLQTPVYKTGNELRVQFPVGSGEDHREHNMKVECGKISKADPESEIVYRDAFKKSEPVKKPDIHKLMREKASLTKQLEANPYDAGALIKLHKLEKSIFEWSQPIKEPGKFTGTTKVQCLTQKQLEGDDPGNAWVRKDMFKRLNKLNDSTAGPGKRLLEQMGWRPGMSLGKTQRGATEPIDLNFNLDRKGLCGRDEMIGAGPVYGALTGLQGRHPVVVLEEECRNRGWGTPYYELVLEAGPPHKKIFHFKVRVNNVDYIPHSGSGSKRQAKVDAAAGALFALGLS